MGRGKMSRILVVLLAVTMLSGAIGGCKAAGNGSNASGDASMLGIGQDLSQGPEAMGRYVEELEDFSDKLSGSSNCLYQLENGSLVITDGYRDFLTTRDSGKTWLADKRNWRTKMLEQDTYIMSIAVGADNTVGVIYQADEDTQKEETELNPKLLIIRPDKTEYFVDIEIPKEDGYLNQVYVSDNGRIFVTTRNSSKLYEVKEDGSSERFLLLEDGCPELIQFQGNLMVMDGYDYSGLVIYDMEREEYIEDQVLNDFINENYMGRDSGSNFYDMYFFFGEEGILYLAGDKGLYRHVIGGSAMEQIIDGNLCSLGNPAYALQGMEALDNNEFIALFEGCRVVHFTYNPDISTIPGEKLRVYGLQDNEIIRQAINLYQRENPEVYIEFEFGMGGKDSVTREDALKKLNTEIMAGEGPDILLLDNMPADSYIEKGLLLDLSPVLDTLSGEEKLFDNIVEAVKTENKIYMIPCEVKLPVMMTDGSYFSSVNDLEDIADMAERMRKEYPQKDLLGLCSEKSIMRLFSMTCAPAWITKEGHVDREAIEEFLKQTKRIYDAQMDGIPDEAMERYRQMEDDYVLYHGVASFEDSDYVRAAGINMMNYVGGFMQLLCGAFDYIDITSIQRIEGFENVEWEIMKGQSSHVFLAETLVGINAASEHTKRAEDFLRVCLGKENQSYLYQSLAVNQSAFDEFFIPEENEVDGNGIYGSVVTVNEEGLRTVLVYYWPDEKQIAELRKCMEEADTAYIENDVLESTVYEEGISYMQGDISLEEAVNVIEKKVAIYMAE